MGFNVGAVKVRQLWNGALAKYFFESPLLRLFKERDYDDVYMEGIDQVDDRLAGEPVPYRSVVIYRYYEQASKELGAGKLPEMKAYADGLSRLILRLRDRVVANKANKVAAKDFRVYLVAHSMGGLVCRAFLQNASYGEKAAKACVDKLFTYATPHNGIDFKLIGNVPGWVMFHNTDDFNRKRMAEYLGITKDFAKDGEASRLTNFDPDRVFCLVGTNARDYGVAGGASKAITGELGDGLVLIRNATTFADRNGERIDSPRAFVHRSHSGHYGIVNSEEGYQNLTRFFFGDVRVDGVLKIDDVTLPPAIWKKKEAAAKKGRTLDIKASYHIEVVVGVRGKQWHLHRRTVNENCAIFRKYDELFGPDKDTSRQRSPHLFSLFLDSAQRVKKGRESLAFAVDLRVLVPDYLIDGFLFLDEHFEGGYVFCDQIEVVATPPATPKDSWDIAYTFKSKPKDSTKARLAETGDGVTFEIPIEQPEHPSIKARLAVTARPWNS
jgi:hypothetical protein